MSNPLRKDFALCGESNLSFLCGGSVYDSCNVRSSTRVIGSDCACACQCSLPSVFPEIFLGEVSRLYLWLSGRGDSSESPLQKGGVPAAPSGTATLLRLSPSHRFYLRALLAVAHFRHSRLPWLDGRCVQGPGTYSPRHG